MKPITIILVVMTNLLFAASSVFFKVAVDKTGNFDLSSARALLQTAGRFCASPFFLSGVASGLAGTGCYYMMLARMNLSVAYPLLSIAYLFTAFASIVFLKEAMGWPHWLGIGLICVGVALVSMKIH
jgi:drug/metabolite transporter (DMT)-like permease